MKYPREQILHQRNALEEKFWTSTKARWYDGTKNHKNHNDTNPTKFGILA